MGRKDSICMKNFQRWVLKLMLEFQNAHKWHKVKQKTKQTQVKLKIKAFVKDKLRHQSHVWWSGDFKNHNLVLPPPRAPRFSKAFQTIFKRTQGCGRLCRPSKVMWYNTNRSVVARGSARPVHQHPIQLEGFDLVWCLTQTCTWFKLVQRSSQWFDLL